MMYMLGIQSCYSPKSTDGVVYTRKRFTFCKANFVYCVHGHSFRFQDSFIEDIESILNSGAVVDLFEPDEFNALAMDLKNEAYISNMSDTPGQLREFFYQVTSIYILKK